MKRFAAKVLIASLLCMSLAGCDDMGSEMGNKHGKEVGGKILESTGDYVYDYQVSMEPIPKEIADLGGPCQGTIHAFPSKIKMALTEQKMEEDPELKAEVEKRKVEVEQYLEKEIGKDFQIEGVIVYDELSWYWICTEVDTGYQFEAFYINSQFFDAKNGAESYERSENSINLNEYYAKYDSIELSSQIKSIIEEIYSDCFCNIIIHSRGYEMPRIEISIIQYTDEQVERSQEQLKTLRLWERFDGMDPAVYDIAWIYCSNDYQYVVETKYNEGLRIDSLNKSGDNIIKKIIKSGDITDYMYYSSGADGRNEVTLDTLLEDKKKDEYIESYIWPYWIEK